MERTYSGRGGIRTQVPDACPAQKICQDTPLRSAQQSKEAQADPAMQESYRLPGVSETFPERR